MRLPAGTIALLAVLALVATGCGAARTPVASLDEPQRPFGTEEVRFPEAGLRFALPVGWLRNAGPAPLVVSVSSGPATVAVWRYPREDPLPGGELAVAGARRALLAAARARDPSLEVTASRATTLDGHPAVEVLATGDVDGRRRALRSTHIYAFGAEIVVDAYAPKRSVKFLEDRVLTPLLRSLQVERP